MVTSLHAGNAERPSAGGRERAAQGMASSGARQLQVVYERIAARTAAIAREQPEWPCRKGCDTCCRRLAGPPELTAAEWSLLQACWEGLGADERRAIDEGLAELERDVAAGLSQLICPLLDRDAGSCRVYAARPAACRTYGFYVSRGDGLFCEQVRARVDRGSCDDVVWGNHDVIEGELERAFGPRRSLLEWVEEGLGCRAMQLDDRDGGGPTTPGDAHGLHSPGATEVAKPPI